MQPWLSCIKKVKKLNSPDYLRERRAGNLFHFILSQFTKARALVLALVLFLDLVLFLALVLLVT